MNKLFKAVADKTRKKEPKITERGIRYRISAFKKEHNIASRKLAQNAYAYEIGINIDNLLSPEELKELQVWLSNKPSPQSHELLPKSKKTASANIRKKSIVGFGLPTNLIKEANKMADIYPDLYEFENLVRYVVMSVLEKKYGGDWWENRNVVSKTIADRVEERRHFERENRWVAKRGTHNIFYTNFGDLAKIINLNTTDFKKIFSNLEIEAELRKLEPLRNIVAHNNLLPPKDIGRVKTALDDLREQLKKYNEEQNRQ